MITSRAGGPPFKHQDLRRRVTKIGFDGMAIAILATNQGPQIMLASSVFYQAQQEQQKGDTQ